VNYDTLMNRATKPTSTSLLYDQYKGNKDLINNKMNYLLNGESSGKYMISGICIQFLILLIKKV
jgi:hypothetical protein